MNTNLEFPANFRFYGMISQCEPVGMSENTGTWGEFESPEGITVPSFQMNSASTAIDREVIAERGAVQALVTAFFALFCIVGLSLWGLPFFYDFMVRQFGWTRAQVTSGNAISKLIVGPAFGFFAGWMVDRFGPRRLMMTGILLAGLALVGLGSVSSLGMFYLFYVFNALGYVCGGPLPNQVLLSRWFDKSRGKAMGIAYLGIGLGGAVSPWISHLLVQRYGWQAALKLLGVLIVVIAFPLAFLVKDVPAQRLISARTASPGIREAFKRATLYLLIAASMCSIAAVSGTQQNLKLFLSLDQHYSQAASTRILSLVLTFSMVGRLLMGWLADRFPIKYVMLLIYALVAAAIPFLFFAPDAAPMYVFAVLFGIGLGGDYMIIPLMTAEIFGLQILGTLLGVILTADGVAEAASPWLVGHLRDVTGSYAAGFSLLVVMALSGAGIAIALPKKAKA
ncbi:MAG TPA: MFS transporter [Terriglobales bacterium]|nr:MFS transporter [Terriglobales bacterium]